jgi:hypothetical protein
LLAEVASTTGWDAKASVQVSGAEAELAAALRAAVR